MKIGNGKKIVFLLYRFFMFFAILGFALTCNITLFLEVFRRASGVEFTRETVTYAAVFTFWNAVFLAVVCTIVDIIRRKISIERPVKRILDATQKIMQGDFSVRITPTRNPISMNEFNPIIEDINRMTQELSTIETLRTDFVATVSHELKTPLSVLQNYGTLLEQPGLSEEKRTEYAKSVIIATKHLSELITNILKLNKLENQNIYPAVQKCNLSEMLCECLLGFESVWEEKKLDIETDIESDVYIRTDSELLMLVWNNLFSNAVKFTDNGGKVSVSLKKDGADVIVSVSDTGCGMSAETGKHIFEKFYQGDSSHSTKGNGLGLALVKRVVDILGGEVNVESELGVGSTFVVKLRS